MADRKQNDGNWHVRWLLGFYAVFCAMVAVDILVGFPKDPAQTGAGVSVQIPTYAAIIHIAVIATYMLAWYVYTIERRNK